MSELDTPADDRRGDWIQTFTGRRFWPLDPRPEDVCIEDIAHALSLKCRFGGHCTRFYSVAEHSVHVSNYVPAEFALWGAAARRRRGISGRHTPPRETVPAGLDGDRGECDAGSLRPVLAAS